MRSGRRGERWTGRTVAWYERANARGDYAERVLRAADPLLSECRSALDVGAGFGALALPLARRLERVTALEPSGPMADALTRAAERQRLGNVSVIRRRWDPGAAEPHDLVVCAHVGSLLEPGAGFLSGAADFARRGVLVVQDAAGGDDKFFYRELYPRLLGRPWAACPRDEDTLAALRGAGIAAIATPIAYRSDQPFESLDEACDFWMTYMGLDEGRAWLREFLAERLVRDGAGWLAPYRKRATVITWPGRAR